MKYFTILVFALAILFSPVAFAVEAGHAVEMPGYFMPGSNIFVSAKDPTCRDVFVSSKQPVIYTKQTVSQKLNIRDSTRIGTGNILAGITGYFNHGEAAVLTGKAEFSCWQSANMATRKTKKMNLGGGIV